MIDPRARRCAGAVLLAAAVGAAGCASVGSVQMADTLGKGHLQVGIEPGVQGALSSTATTSSAAFAPYPHLDAALRYGVSDTVDVGARVGLSLFEVQTKVLLTRPGDPHLAVSLAPTLGALVLAQSLGTAGTSSALGLNLAVPILVGLKTRGGSEVVLGPRLQNLVVFAGASSGAGAVYVLGAGATVGFALRASDTFVLLPEFSLVFPLVRSAGASSLGGAFSGLAGGPMLQFKLGLLLGHLRPLRPEEAPPPAPAE